MVITPNQDPLHHSLAEADFTAAEFSLLAGFAYEVQLELVSRSAADNIPLAVVLRRAKEEWRAEEAAVCRYDARQQWLF